MVNESQTIKSELIELITERGGDADDTSTTADALHRTWIDVKNAFVGDNAESTLENVTFGEKAAIDAYQNALDSGDFCSQSKAVVSGQLGKLKSSYSRFESLERRTN